MRLLRCAGPNMLELNMANGLLCEGDDEVEETDDEGEEQSSDVERLRLSTIVFEREFACRNSAGILWIMLPNGEAMGL